MKNLIAIGMAAAIAMTSAAIPAKADNSEEVIIGVLGGVIGGMVLGGAIANADERRAPRARYYERYPVERRVVRRKHVRECTSIVVKEYDPYTDEVYFTRKLSCY